MLRAAKRARSDDDETDKPLKVADVSAIAEKAADTQPSRGKIAVAAVTQTSADPEAAIQVPLQQGHVSMLKPIADRRPAEVLDPLTRRNLSIENLGRIGNALKAYIEKNGYVPQPAIKSANGIELLSWRVELLPYLGHQDLYDKFDLQSPWDSPANLALLDLIPDCYVSPERYDSRTNYLGIAGPGYLFNGRYVTRSEIEDGLENTLIVAEVNDPLAVPWTSPQDYQVDYHHPGAGLGQLRDDGTYALWGNGWTTRLRKDLSQKLLHNALTYDSGDAQSAGLIHQSLRVETAATVAVSSSPGQAAISPPATQSISTQPSRPAETARGGASLPRLAVPKAESIQDAGQRVRALYSPRFGGATNVAERQRIAGEMLATASLMKEDPAGAYAMQQAVLQIAASTADVGLLIQAVDRRVEMFEVDAVIENTQALAQFIKSNGGPQMMRVDQRHLFRRALPVIDQSVRQDEYPAAIDLATYLLATQRQAKNRLHDAEIAQLKTQLKVASDYLATATEAIAALRRDESDGAAMGAVGRYTAFIKGDWKNGLAMLCKGNNERLASLARADLSTSAEPDQMLVTADHWWDLGDATSSQLFRGGCYERAAFWYTSAHEALPESLAKLHAKSRIGASKGTVAGSPLAMIQRVAARMQINLQRETQLMLSPKAASIAVDEED